MRLRDRRFLPPAPLTLPTGDLRAIERALDQRTQEELAGLAESLVADPDPATAPQACEVALAVFLRVPRASARAARLIDALATHGHPVALARLRLALTEGRPADATAILAELSGDARVEGLVRLATVSLASATAHGADWLVPCADGVANITLAFARRPALEAEMGEAGPWLRELASAPAGLFIESERADAVGDHELAARRYAASLKGDELERVRAARARLLGDIRFEPAPLDAPPLPRTGLIARLSTLASPSLPALEAPHPLDAAIHERLGDLRKAAERYLADAMLGRADALREAVRLRAQLIARERRTLTDLLAGDPRLLDERELSHDPELRERAALLLTLAPDTLGPFGPLRLSVASPAAPAPATRAPTPADDPHHPESRLAAASDLLAAAKLDPASNILAALLRKVDEATPARLFTVVAQALEADEPPAELLNATRRALTDEVRSPRLLAALVANPTAAFALHEELRGVALSGAHPDGLRLRALETWLGIWRATETAPDPDAIRSLREAEPHLLVAAAASLAGLPEPIAAIRAFLTRHPPHGTTPEDFSEALLALSLGRAS